MRGNQLVQKPEWASSATLKLGKVAGLWLGAGMLIDCILNPAEIALLPKRDLSATTCVVFDVLRATSSMVTALANGAREIHPVCTLEEAFDLKKEERGVLLGGERGGERPDGFDFGNSPLEYQDVRGARIAWTTTNGTIALRACEHAERVLVGALLNLGAVVDELRWAEPARVLLVCAGTGEDFALEDAYAAGRLAGELSEAERTDSARAVESMARAFPDPLAALSVAANGRALLSRGKKAEVQWCARVSAYSVGGFMDGSVVRPIE
jgi:2-phosphosulfolactate phosphatase